VVGYLLVRDSGASADHWRLVFAVCLLLAHVAVIAVAVFAISGDGGDSAGRSGDNAADTFAPEPRTSRAVARFPSAHDEPPIGWSGPVFQLSQDYPDKLPPLEPAPWLHFDFRTQSEQYLRAVLDYALEGNIEVDFRGQDNQVRKWFHAPWLHADPMNEGSDRPVRAREFIHGLTRERSSRPGELAPTQTETVQNWAVGLYNPRGGYVLGQVWRNPDSPDPRGAEFPEGSVAFKLLFTAASTAQVPFLKNSLEWQADITRSKGSEPRPELRLLQIDVAVRDSRADSTTGWVFGTFIYDGDAHGDSIWDRMVPIGAMWGNDPDRLNDDGPLQETVINADATKLVQHLGYKGRLNGPVDNPRSSCLSCHSTAQTPNDVSDPTVPSVPRLDASREELAMYFRNIRAQMPFTEGQDALDYSLQLQNGIANWARVSELRYPAPPSLVGPQRRYFRKSDEVRIRPITRD
jgi:hypothetical protein